MPYTFYLDSKEHNENTLQCSANVSFNPWRSKTDLVSVLLHIDNRQQALDAVIHFCLRKNDQFWFGHTKQAKNAINNQEKL